MIPKAIGVIGGAGPMAGVFFLEKLFQVAQVKFGCWKDGDFPKVHLISFPFSDMLSSSVNHQVIESELQECLCSLRKNGAFVQAIACNTLHAFLRDRPADLVHLPYETASVLKATPLVFCSSTSAVNALHKSFFPCHYPDEKTQGMVDRCIEQILKGDLKNSEKKLVSLISKTPFQEVVLGCTEFSLLTEGLRKKIPEKRIIDPLELTVNKVLEISFGEIEP